MNWQLFGIIAGVFTTAGFLPQIWQGYKTKHLKDLSYGMNGMLGFGMALWLVYGFARKDVAIIAANIVGVVFNLTLIAMKLYYSRTSEKKEK